MSLRIFFDADFLKRVLYHCLQDSLLKCQYLFYYFWSWVFLIISEYVNGSFSDRTSRTHCFLKWFVEWSNKGILLCIMPRGIILKFIQNQEMTTASQLLAGSQQLKKVSSITRAILFSVKTKMWKMCTLELTNIVTFWYFVILDSCNGGVKSSHLSYEFQDIRRFYHVEHSQAYNARVLYSTALLTLYLTLCIMPGTTRLVHNYCRKFLRSLLIQSSQLTDEDEAWKD